MSIEVVGIFMKIQETIYLDHQATTPLDSRVLKEMLPYLEGGFGNPHSTEHAIGWRASQAVEQAASDISSLIGCDPDEIVFTSGATEANNLALLGLAHGKAPKNRRRILLSAIEHKCVLEIGRRLSSDLEFDVEVIPVDAHGHVDLDALAGAISDEVFLVSVMAANNEIGTIQDIEEISKLAAAAGSLLHCDAAQAPCAMDVSQLAVHADLISLSSHKMYGPAGIGALFARRELHHRIQPIIIGGGQQNGLRSGTLPTALCVGFGAAARISSSEEGSRVRSELAELNNKFLEQLNTLPCGVWVNGPLDTKRKHPGNLNIGLQGISAADLLASLQPSLAASSGSACTSGIPEPSHVLRAIGLDGERAASCVRFSLGKGTTITDIQEAARLIEQAVVDLIDIGLLRTG
ncbi:cysteine desulfurase family protein [Sedimentitalea sp. JM2-8]|uniref:Cysteine desulfurase n=1 Tax=Sedimentitalea xiamensis TaxID=3050037 RepID=A0ABT7FKK4_9RHOB|nr:cysteine desulfurase family protein [Sedimentitalea xiamensis]MDK3075500.1 cysteine desulfurase family protein [Sedimentitalea xiamensis]